MLRGASAASLLQAQLLLPLMLPLLRRPGRLLLPSMLPNGQSPSPAFAAQTRTNAAAPNAALLPLAGICSCRASLLFCCLLLLHVAAAGPQHQPRMAEPGHLLLPGITAVLLPPASCCCTWLLLDPNTSQGWPSQGPAELCCRALPLQCAPLL
jgi:hypothetical protein